MLRWAIDATVLALILAAAQGCGSNSSSAAPDAATGDDASTTDGGVHEASPEAEAGPDCGAMPPTGKQVVASKDPLTVLDVTQDGHAVYEDLTTQELYAVAVAGGTPSDIGKMTSQGGTVYSHGGTVLYLPSAANPQNNIAPLSAWSAASGTNVITTSAFALDSYFYSYDASKDGKYVVYFATSDAATATLTVSTIDGKTQTPLATNIDLTNQNCFPPALQFVNDTVIGQYCQIVTDGGAEATTIAAFTGPAFTAVTLGSTFPAGQGGPQTVDPTGTLALEVDPADQGLKLFPLAGGAPVLVDAKGLGGIFAANGDVIYTTSAKAMMRYSAKSATSTSLVPAALFPQDLSPDGNWLQAVEKQNATTGQTDLYLASATTAGSATAVVTTTTTSAGGFTADSQYSLFGTNFPMNFGSTTFDLEASKTSGGPAAKVLSPAGRVLPTGGSKIVAGINQSKSTGAVDIVSLDVSTKAMPTALVTQADPNLFMTSTKDVVYSWYCNETAKAGIWTLTPP